MTEIVNWYGLALAVVLALPHIVCRKNNPFSESGCSNRAMLTLGFDTSNYTTTIANRFTSDLQEADIHVSGFTYKDANDVIHISGTDSYTLDLTGNGLVTADNADTVLTNIYNKRTAYTYRPFTATVVSAPYLWPMDVISFQDKDGNGHVSALTNVNITINGNMSIAAKGVSQKENSYATPGAFSSRQAAVLQQIQQASTNNLNEAIDNATKLITGADGGHVRFIYDSNNELSEIVIMDTPSIDTAVKVWRWNSGGLGFSDNGYNGTYRTAITNDGSIVANLITTGELDANIIKTGTLDGDFVNAKKLSILDGNGNVVATYDSTITLGNAANDAYLQIDGNGMSVYNKDNARVMVVGSLPGNQGKTYVVDTFIGNAITHHFHTIYNCTVADIQSVSIDGNEADPSTYTVGADGSTGGYGVWVMFNSSSKPQRNEVIQVGYLTTDRIVHIDMCEDTDYDLYPPGNWSSNNGSLNAACGRYCHAEGYDVEAFGSQSHAEGKNTVAYAESSHAEGADSSTYIPVSHAEGYNTKTTVGSSSIAASPVTGGNHAEGNSTTASGIYGAHAEGYGSITDGDAAHAEGKDTQALHNYSHAQGVGTVTGLEGQFVFGKYNMVRTVHAEVVGWGTPSTPDDIRRLSTGGNMWIKGTLTQGSDARLKTECGEVPDVSSVRAKVFKWNDNLLNHDDLTHIGYFAQDVEKVAPYLVTTDEVDGRKSLDYIAFLCAKVECLERRIAELERNGGDS